MDGRPEPRRRNLANMQARILAAAFDLFASRGYAKTSLREIAEAAGVATSLVVRYFGTKAALFEQSLVDALFTRGFFVEDKRNFGEEMAWRLVGEDARITAMVVLSIADTESRDIARRITRDIIAKSLAEWLGPPDADGRALHMLSLLNGFMIQTRHLLTGPVSEASVHRLARSLQMIVDEENPPEAAGPGARA
ncbi:MAG TPA: TetR family transcriptional regulator [Sphingobium sp.]|uniref:TetR/AcrR family transcriptional regulator n=1 Tax=Sphingobium sp. TaxID=1912891 RepID=UPI002ED2FB58